MTETAAPQLWTPEDTARFLQVTENVLAQMRHKGDGPPFLKFGRRIRYVPRAVHDWAKACTKTSTKEK